MLSKHSIVTNGQAPQKLTLMWQTWSGWLNIVELLLERGADVTVRITYRN